VEFGIRLIREDQERRPATWERDQPFLDAVSGIVNSDQHAAKKPSIGVAALLIQQHNLGDRVNLSPAVSAFIVDDVHAGERHVIAFLWKEDVLYETSTSCFGAGLLHGLDAQRFEDQRAVLPADVLLIHPASALAGVNLELIVDVSVLFGLLADDRTSDSDTSLDLHQALRPVDVIHETGIATGRLAVGCYGKEEN
jgi:hypothetical protein